MHRPLVPATFLALAAAVLLPACTATKLEARPQLPPPLIDKHPVRVGVHYPPEFSQFVHKETRGTIDYEVTLGPAHVTNLDWLLKAMFSEVVPVADPTRAASVRPPVVFVLEPKFEEFSFLTPKDVAGEAFIVTIRYLLTLYDGTGARVDSFTYTGYGRERARTLASKEPLQIATQRAMRDAGAKVAVELTDQEAIRLLIRNAGHPLGAPPGSVAPPGTQPIQILPRSAPPAGAAPKPPSQPDAEKTPSPAGEAPPATPPSVEVPPTQSSPQQDPPAQTPPVEEPPVQSPSEPETPPAPEAGREETPQEQVAPPSVAGV